MWQVLKVESISTNAEKLSYVSIRNTVIEILKRYREYERLIRYPGDWGERAFRFWIIKELFIDVLGWPSKSVVFGERYDVLLIDELIRPIIYIETKRPGKQIDKEDVEEAVSRAREFFSIDYIVVTNGITWILHDYATNRELAINNIEKADEKTVLDFFSKLRAKNFIGLER